MSGSPNNDNHVLVTVELLNVRNDVERFLLEEKVHDQAARRALAINLREVAKDLEGAG